MTAMIASVHDRLASAHRSGQPLALFFDYDGTLTPIVQFPSWARLAPETRETLSRLAAIPRVHVGIFSGRSLSDLKQMVSIADVLYCGSTGLEIEYRTNTRTHADMDKTRTLMTEIEQQLRRTLADYSGAWLEGKQFGLAVHFRQVNPTQVEKLQCDVGQILQQFANRVRVWPSPMAIEMIPDLGCDKGTGVRESASMVGDECLVLYAGDYANDAEAFEIVESLNGITLGIGPNPPQSAQHRLANPIQLQRFLLGLVTMLSNVTCTGSAFPI